LDVGKTTQKTVVVRNDGFHLGLLEHELGDQDAVGVGRAPPGQVASVAAVPTQEVSSDGGPFP